MKIADRGAGLMHCVLGIDTSNYTTSVCAVAADSGKMVAEARQLLPVEKGDRGLRQSDAHFFHVRQLPEVMHRLMENIRCTGVYHTSWSAIGVTVRPRPFASSYMPVFHAGESFARVFAEGLSIPVVRSSHQEGHVAAAEYFLPKDTPSTFAAVHISGGTSDVMVVKRTRFGYNVDLVGEGSDLHAGQFVDRVGVALGLTFPAGPKLEQLARLADEKASFRIPTSVNGSSMSFSGPCSAALRAIQNGVEKSEIARAVEICIANSVIKAVSHAFLSHLDLTCAVIAGGVASNEWIRNRVLHRFHISQPDVQILFAPVAYSSDNALGIATIAHRFMVQV
jgi:N6-L-threonylcarbamoyladenine synthase